MNPKLQSLYSLKFNPFRPDVPVEALFTTPAVDAFLRRVELGIADGGYVLVTGDPGTGKSVALRLLGKRLAALRDVVVGTIEHPQSRTMDFYRELGDLFGVPLQVHNRWGGFKALRTRWAEHIASTLLRPVLVLDEAQEALGSVLTELRVLASKDLDSRQLLCVVLAGDARLVERLRSALRPLPLSPYEYAEWKRVTLSIDYHAEFEGHYSRASAARRVDPGAHPGMGRHRRHQHPAVCRAPARRTDSPRARLPLVPGSVPSFEEVRNGSCRSSVRARLRCGACSYRHVASILQHGLDRAPALDIEPRGPRVTHENVRGRDYYH